MQQCAGALFPVQWVLPGGILLFHPGVGLVLHGMLLNSESPTPLVMFGSLRKQGGRIPAENEKMAGNVSLGQLYTYR